MVTLSVRDSAKLELLLSPELFALKVLFNATGFSSFHSTFLAVQDSSIGDVVSE